MGEQVPQPGMEIVPGNPGGGGVAVPPQLLLATDLAVGAAAQATRAAVRVGSIAWGAGAVVGQLVASLPGAGGATRLLDSATRPLVEDGSRIRARAGAGARLGTQRLLESFVPGVVDALDIDEIVQRIDIDRLVRRIEIDDLVARIDIDALVSRIDIDRLVSRIQIDALVRRIDIDALVKRIDVDALVARIDIDRLVRRIEIDDVVRRIDIDPLVQRIDIDRLVRRIEIDLLVGRIDIDAVVGRIDVNEVVQRVNVDAIVEETELGTIVARSTSGFATAALDAARSQTAGVDTRVSRAVNRVLRRKDAPEGPPLLRSDPHIEEEGVEWASGDRYGEPSSPEPSDADPSDGESTR